MEFNVVDFLVTVIRALGRKSFLLSPELLLTISDNSSWSSAEDLLPKSNAIEYKLFDQIFIACLGCLCALLYNCDNRVKVHILKSNIWNPNYQNTTASNQSDFLDNKMAGTGFGPLSQFTALGMTTSICTNYRSLCLSIVASLVSIGSKYSPADLEAQKVKVLGRIISTAICKEMSTNNLKHNNAHILSLYLDIMVASLSMEGTQIGIDSSKRSHNENNSLSIPDLLQWLWNKRVNGYNDDVVAAALPRFIGAIALRATTSDISSKRLIALVVQQASIEMLLNLIRYPHPRVAHVAATALWTIVHASEQGRAITRGLVKSKDISLQHHISSFDDRNKCPSVLAALHSFLS